ncbi:MAG: DsbC family protein, partial [Gammaproteobacteria bacterium]
MYKLIISFVITIFCTQTVWAGEAEDIDKITERLGKLAPQEKPESIKPTAISGLYEVVFGSDIFYSSADGRYVLQGALLDLDTNENLTETTRTDIRKRLMSKLNSSEMIVFSPKEKPRHTLTVFTDIDCGYCRKLHAEMDELNSYGIEVRYMMFPRTGLNTPSYQKAVNVWCAKDQQVSMTKAKAGESIPQANCDNPVASQFNLGQQL